MARADESSILRGTPRAFDVGAPRAICRLLSLSFWCSSFSSCALYYCAWVQKNQYGTLFLKYIGSAYILENIAYAVAPAGWGPPPEANALKHFLRYFPSTSVHIGFLIMFQCFVFCAGSMCFSYSRVVSPTNYTTKHRDKNVIWSPECIMLYFVQYWSQYTALFLCRSFGSCTVPNIFIFCVFFHVVNRAVSARRHFCLSRKTVAPVAFETTRSASSGSFGPANVIEYNTMY